MNIGYGTVVKELLSYIHMPYNWDGYGGVAAKAGNVESAIQLLGYWNVCSAELPKTTLPGDGIPGLYLHTDKGYVELMFDVAGMFSFYVDWEGECFGGEDLPIDKGIPKVLVNILEDKQ